MGQRELVRRVGLASLLFAELSRKLSSILIISSWTKSLKRQTAPKRLNFCRFVREQTTLDQNFWENVLFSDEASFSNNGGVNKHNCHYCICSEQPALNSRRTLSKSLFNKCLVWNIGKQNYRTILFL